VVYHRKLEHLPGFAITGSEPAHLTVIAVVTGPRAADLVSEIEPMGGRAHVGDDGALTAELPEVVAAIDLVLDALLERGERRGAVHMGKITANDDALGGHAGRATALLAELADPGQALITGGVIVEMGDDGFERFATGSMGAAELDGTSYAVYEIHRRDGGAPTT
jgi:hypothetical protein